jgi:hypothetical protein
LGRVLQIRVSAYTFDPSEVEKNWPHLFEVVFAQDQKVSNPGVRELLKRLKEKVLFEDLDPRIAAFLEPQVKELESWQKKLDTALANWEPQKANEISYLLEEKLDQIEQKLKEIL